MSRSAFFPFATFAVAGMLGITGTAAATDDWEAELSTERVSVLHWERLDDAFRYHIEVDGEEIATAVGDSAAIALDPDTDPDDIRIDSSTMQGEPTGETELRELEGRDALLLRWNEDAMEKPYLGVHIKRVDGNRTSQSRSVSELTNHPHVITADPDDIQVMLFGDAVDRDDRRQPGAPFEFDDDEILEHGSHIELELP